VGRERSLRWRAAASIEFDGDDPVSLPAGCARSRLARFSRPERKRPLEPVASFC
jgi:hypothetical protein